MSALSPKIGANVQQQLEGDLKDEEDAVHQYNSAMNICAEAGDNGSGNLFQSMLKDEEGTRTSWTLSFIPSREWASALPRPAMAW